MGRMLKRLRRKLNQGKQKMDKNKFAVGADRHGYLTEAEIGYEELGEVFLCSMQTVREWIKILRIEPERISNGKHAFNRVEIIKTLNNWAVDGKLTFDKKLLNTRTTSKAQ